MPSHLKYAANYCVFTLAGLGWRYAGSTQMAVIVTCFIIFITWELFRSCLHSLAIGREPATLTDFAVFSFGIEGAAL